MLLMSGMGIMIFRLRRALVAGMIAMAAMGSMILRVGTNRSHRTDQDWNG